MAMLYKEAVVYGIWTEFVLWGFFFVLYVMCVHVLLRHRATESIQWFLLSTASLLFILESAHIAVQFRRLYEGFIQNAHTPGGPEAYLNNLGNKVSLIADSINATIIIIGDSVVIHRCFLIWGKRIRVIILPVLLLLGTAVAGYITVWLFTQIATQGPAFHGLIARCALASFILSLATNIVTTSLITYRILSTAHQVSSEVDVQPYINGLAIIVESAAIYTTGLIIYLIVFLMRTNAQYIVFCALCPLAGIAPTLIIVRANIGRKRAPPQQVSEGGDSFISPTTYLPPAHPIPAYPFKCSPSIYAHHVSGLDATTNEILFPARCRLPLNDVSRYSLDKGK